MPLFNMQSYLVDPQPNVYYPLSYKTNTWAVKLILTGISRC